MLFIKAFTSYFHIYRPPTPPAVASPTSSAITHLIAPTAQYTTITKNRRRAVVETSSLGLHSLVAERRHSSVTRYAKRSVACRDSPRHQPLRAGGTPLPHHHRIAHPHRPPSSSDCASTSSAIHLYALRRCAPAPTAQAVTPSVNPRPRRGYTHRRICAAERRR